MADLTRDALIQAVRDEISGWPIGCGYYQTTIGTDEAEELAPAAVDAVLGLVADDLDRKADSDHDMNCSCEKCIEQTGVLIAAHHIRSLLPSAEGDQP